MIDALPLLLGPEGYQISRSVRLRSSASAYFNRTMTASFTSQRIFTFSFWCKRGTLSTAQSIFDRNQSTNVNQFAVGFNSNDTFAIAARTSGTSTIALNLVTSAVFRDPSAWYHFVIAVDNTQATLANRGKIYVNGVLQSLGTQTATQNVDYHLLSGLTYDIGRTALTASQYFDGYLTEFNFIDGQSLTPSSFGETDAVTGVWKPKKYAGTYGTNGFYLNFSDNSAATAAAIGKDYSGNGNNWTPNNITLSPTTSASYDSMLDVPTLWGDGGNGRGNYATLNPLSTLYTVTNGNLDFTYTNSTSGVWYLKDTLAVSYGKYYWEVTPTNVGAGLNISIGIILDTNTQTNTTTINLVTDGYVYHSDGNKYSGSTVAAYGATYTNNDVIGVALDLTAGTLVFYKNNVSQGTAFTGLTSSYMLLVCCHLGGTSRTVAGSVNAGQRPFTYTPPSGFKALNTLNLPEPTILNGNQYFDITKYTGNGSTQTLTNSSAMQPDLVWVKSRSAAATDHQLVDSVRGNTKSLSSNLTAAEATNANNISITSTGFSVGALGDLNTNGATYVGWQWKEGATQGFDIVTYTGDATINRTVAHALGVQPSMFIIKARSAAATSWMVHHKDLGNNGGSPAYLQYLQLESTAAKAASTSLFPVAGLSPTTFPTSGATNNTNVNGSGTTYVAYLFAEVAGFSKFGSYTGNGSPDGPFVFCGFRPRWIMVKITSGGTGFWHLIDTARNTYNQNGLGLYPNSSNAESSDFASDTLSNGFKIRNTQSEINGSGFTYIFAAFAENPFKNALAR